MKKITVALLLSFLFISNQIVAKNGEGIAKYHFSQKETVFIKYNNRFLSDSDAQALSEYFTEQFQKNFPNSTFKLVPTTQNTMGWITINIDFYYREKRYTDSDNQSSISYFIDAYVDFEGKRGAWGEFDNLKFKLALKYLGDREGIGGKFSDELYMAFSNRHKIAKKRHFFI